MLLAYGCGAEEREREQGSGSNGNNMRVILLGGVVASSSKIYSNDWLVIISSIDLALQRSDTADSKVTGSVMSFSMVSAL